MIDGFVSIVRAIQLNQRGFVLLVAGLVVLSLVLDQPNLTALVGLL